MSGTEKHQPLYLKYRPQCLADLVGQAAVARTLSNAIASGRIAHAYLFTGPRGTGKTSSARILAKSLNCESGPTANPCLQCIPCQEIRDSKSPGVFEIDAASNNSVDDARVLIERAPLVSVSGKYKIYIIDECHMLTKEAFNALLKTIEEPPANVIFILATTEEHKVPPTIVSRCQRLMFRLVSQQDLVPHLRNVAGKEEIEIDTAALELIARRSGGGLRDALGLLDQASLLAAPGKPVGAADLLVLMGAVHEDVLLQMSKHIQQRKGKDLLELANKLLMEGREPGLIALELARHFLSLTKACYIAAGQESTNPETLSFLACSPQYASGLLEQATGFELGELSQIVEQLDRLEQTVRRTTQPAMALEMGLLSVCHRHDILLVHELDARVKALEEMLAGGSVALPPAHAARPVQQKPVVVEQPAPVKNTPPAERVVPHLVPNSLPMNEPSSPPAQIIDSEQSGSAAAASEAHLAPLLTPPPAPTGMHNSDVIDDEAEYDNNDRVALETFWSRLMDQLQRVNIPAYSVLSEHAFPLGLTEKDCTIGVLTEHFQKTVEKRAEKIKVACEAVLGRQVVMKVKVVSDQPVKSNRARSDSGRSHGDSGPAAPAEFATAERASSSSGESDDEEPAPALPSAPSPPPGFMPASQPAIDKPAQGLNDSAPKLESETGSGPRVVSGKAASSALSNHDGIDATTVRDAYKIFEGPGSRLIV